MQQRRAMVTLTGVVLLLASTCTFAQEIDTTPSSDGVELTGGSSALPDAPSSTQAQHSKSFGQQLGDAAKTIGQDEWNIVKAPFQPKMIIWDALAVGATGVLIANDESVLYQVPTSWHDTSIAASNAALGATAATAGGIFISGLITGDEHAKETGIRSAEGAVDSVILYGAMKAIFARQRPFTGEGEGKFFSGNWTNGSFPSGHAMFTWTVASVVAHEYHSIWVQLLMYGMATTVSTTRVTARQHFPADVFAGSVMGYGVGTYVAHKGTKPKPPHTFAGRMSSAVMNHVAIGVE